MPTTRALAEANFANARRFRFRATLLRLRADQVIATRPNCRLTQERVQRMDSRAIIAGLDADFAHRVAATQAADLRAA